MANRQKTDEEWKKELTSEQYHVLREKGTDAAFTGALTNNHEDGMYHCAACNAPLFSSEAKFDSGSGWPSFTDPHIAENIEMVADNAMGTQRTEVICKKCGGHLGHVFPDGPGDSGKRFCINSTSLNFEKEDEG